jgi:hypothetical protein
LITQDVIIEEYLNKKVQAKIDKMMAEEDSNSDEEQAPIEVRDTADNYAQYIKEIKISKPEVYIPNTITQYIPEQRAVTQR